MTREEHEKKVFFERLPYEVEFLTPQLWDVLLSNLLDWSEIFTQFTEGILSAVLKIGTVGDH